MTSQKKIGREGDNIVLGLFIEFQSILRDSSSQVRVLCSRKRTPMVTQFKWPHLRKARALAAAPAMFDQREIKM